MGFFSSNAKVQQSVDNATKAFQAIVHQSTAAFTRNANDAAKKATDSIDVLSRQKTVEFNTSARQIADGMSKAAQEMANIFINIAKLPMAQLGPRALFFLVFAFLSGSAGLLFLNYILKRKLLLEKHRLFLERQSLRDNMQENLQNNQFQG